MKVPANTKPWIQGMVVGAVAAMIIGFSWGGWVTGGSADKQAATAAHDATVAALAPVCADNYKKQPDAIAKLAELSKASFYERSGLVDKGGFAKLAGPSLEDDVARACATLLTTPKS